MVASKFQTISSAHGSQKTDRMGGDPHAERFGPDQVL